MQSSNFTNLQDLITYNSGTKTDALGRIFPYGTVLDPATTRTVAAGTADPVTGLPNNTSTQFMCATRSSMDLSLRASRTIRG
jgi:hypothetical protein